MISVKHLKKQNNNYNVSTCGGLKSTQEIHGAKAELSHWEGGLTWIDTTGFSWNGRDLKSERHTSGLWVAVVYFSGQGQ